MNAVIKAELATTTALVPTSLTDAIRLAEVMARAHTVPRHLQDSPGDCLMVVEQAMRWRMSPFAVAQATSVISGKLMYEGKLVAAAVETSGAITGHLDYTFTGTGEDRAVTVSATRRGETNPRSVTVTVKEARTNNEMWRRQPDQQLVYHGARVWARRWAPAVILGVYSGEEMGPVIEGTVEPDSVVEETITTPHVSAAVREEESAADDPKPTPKRTRRQFLDDLETRLQGCTSREEYDLIATSREVMEAQRTFSGEGGARLMKLLAEYADALEGATGTFTPEDRLEA